MDDYYANEAVANALSKVMKERTYLLQGKKASENLSMFKSEGFIVKKFEEPVSWRIVATSKNTETCEELVLKMQGVLGDMELPPLSSVEIPRPHRIAFLRQHVGLVGLGAPAFEIYTDKMLEICQMIGATMPEGYLQQWMPSQFNGYLQIDAHARYFSTEKEAKLLEVVPFSTYVDPSGALARMASRELVHTIENDVQYLSCTVQKEGQPLYRSIDPAIFRTGDIVEIQFTVMAIPLKGVERAKPLVILRALTMLDNSFSKQAALKRAKATIKPMAHSMPAPKLTRKIGYDEEEQEVRESRHAIASLNLGSGDGFTGEQGRRDFIMGEG